MFLTQSPYFLMAALVAIASGAIFAVRFVKPEASEESDVIFATMGLIYSISLLLEGAPDNWSSSSYAAPRL